MPDRPWNRSMASDPWRVLDVVVVGGRKVKIAIVAVLLFALMAKIMIAQAAEIEEVAPVQPEYKKMQATAY